MGVLRNSRGRESYNQHASLSSTSKKPWVTPEHRLNAFVTRFQALMKQLAWQQHKLLRTEKGKLVKRVISSLSERHRQIIRLQSVLCDCCCCGRAIPVATSFSGCNWFALHVGLRLPYS